MGDYRRGVPRNQTSLQPTMGTFDWTAQGRGVPRNQTSLQRFRGSLSSLCCVAVEAYLAIKLRCNGVWRPPPFMSWRSISRGVPRNQTSLQPPKQCPIWPQPRSSRRTSQSNFVATILKGSGVEKNGWSRRTSQSNFVATSPVNHQQLRGITLRFASAIIFNVRNDRNQL